MAKNSLPAIDWERYARESPSIPAQIHFPSMSYSITKSIRVENPPVALVKRPWGSFKRYANNSDCMVSLMTVLPGQRLCMQSHSERAELWIVLAVGVVVPVPARCVDLRFPSVTGSNPTSSVMRTISNGRRRATHAC